MKQLITAIFISYVLTVSAFAMSEQSPPSQRTQQQNEVYLGHLKYEYRNRGRTYLGMRTAAKYSAGSDRGTFFQAYSDLENVSREIYAHMASELGVDYQPNWFIRNGLPLATYLGWRFVSAQQLVDIIVPYMPKLEEMKALSDPRHRQFFEYAVAQEAAQLAASRAAAQGQWDDGAKVFTDFMPTAESELKRLSNPSNANL